MDRLDRDRNIELMREEILVAIGHFLEFLTRSEDEIASFIASEPQYSRVLGLLLRIAVNRVNYSSPSLSIPDESLRIVENDKNRRLFIQELGLAFQGQEYTINVMWDEDQRVMIGFTFEDTKGLGFSIIIRKNNTIDIPIRIFTPEGTEYIRLGTDILEYRYFFDDKSHVFTPFIEDI